MTKKIIIDASYPGETRVVLLNEQSHIEAIEYETANKHQIKGNIYLAKIIRVEPALQAAFIEYGGKRNGFLPFSEIHRDYYHIPVSDREEQSGVVNFQAITPPSITSEDMVEQEALAQNARGELKEEIEDIILDASDSDVEPISNSKPDTSYRDYKIQDVIKKGQVILVQAQKEERGNKGASFTSYISLAGKYCVLMPNVPESNGISKKIASLTERKRLRDIISNLTKEDTNLASVIVRTAGISRTTYEIKRDYDYLARLWNKIRERTIQSTAPAFIHMEDGIILKVVRDMFDNSVSEIIVQGRNAHQHAMECIRNMMPSDEARLKEYKDAVPIFTKYELEAQLAKLYQPIASLPSGGYIVINPTEAMISIDVNSGRATSERNIEETALKTNIEAAHEIARQMRLRDLSGLLVIDFIDMYESRHRQLVEKTLKQQLSRDPARIQVGNISTFGLLEMSRQRLRSSFLEANTKMCHHCNGKGTVRADESNAMLILRTIENEIFRGKLDVVNIFAHLDVVLYLMNHKRKEVTALEEKYKIKCNFLSDANATSDSFSMEKIKYPSFCNDASSDKRNALLSGAESFLIEDATPGDSPNIQQNQAPKKSKWKNKKKADKQESVISPDTAEVLEQLTNFVEESQAPTETAQAENVTPPASKRAPGNRGRKRIGEKAEKVSEAATPTPVESDA
ncbi:MAG: Rne/Rng family ribonuclease [Pseudomonadota bacterium]